MNIYLIGFMGSGKTTIGKKLAQRLNYDFLDLDNLIEARAGSSINDYFNTHGEEKFRQLERDILVEASTKKNTIIATGGGTPCFHDNMEFMNANGKTIYLHIAAKGLVPRLENAKTERPLIKDLNTEELEEYISKKLEERKFFYEQSQYLVSGLDLSAEKLEQYLQLSQAIN